MGGQPGAEAAGSLNSPDPPTGRMGGGEGIELTKSERVRGDCEPFDDATSGSDDCGGVRVPVGVDADDELDFVCKHGCHGVLHILLGFIRLAPAWMGSPFGKTVMRHDRNGRPGF